MKYLDDVVSTYTKAKNDLQDVMENVVVFGRCKHERSWFANSGRGEHRELEIEYGGARWLVKKLNGCCVDIQLLP